MSAMLSLAVVQDYVEALTHDQTTFHPLGLAAVVILGGLTLGVPRRFAMLPMLAMACFVPTGQRLVIASLDFDVMRIMVLFGWLRVALRGEYRGLRWQSADTALVLWSFASMVAFTALHGTVGALVNRLGRSYDVVGMYLFFRCVMRSWADLDRVALGVLWLGILSLFPFLLEQATGRNPFAILGGVPVESTLREGRVRCQGPFAGPILAGCFWATLLPLAAARWWRSRRGRPLVVAGVTAMAGVIMLCVSSTPLMGVAAAIVGGAFFVVRYRMREIRWSVLATLFALHLVMKAPVWHLVSRIDLAGGSTGHHRFALIDNAIRRFDEWWLFGTESTRHWGYDMRDTANQYVEEAVLGGFGALVMLVVVLSLAFRNAGRVWRAARGTRYYVILSWAFGVSLFAQAVMFIAISISSSPQNLMLLLFAFSTMTSLASTRRMRRRAKVSQRMAA